MPQVHITPHPHPSSLLRVRDQLYGGHRHRRHEGPNERPEDPGLDHEAPEQSADLAARRRAIATLRAWQTRKPLYLPVAATADLAEAELALASSRRDHGSSSSPSPSPSPLDPSCSHPTPSDYPLRAIFATSLIRFVGAYVDTAQTSAGKRSARDVALEIGLPERWVHLRNRLAHEARLPPLAVLVAEARGALGWLFETYWAGLRGRGGDEEEGEEGVEEMVEGVVRRFVRERRREVLSRGGGGSEVSRRAAVELIGMCRGKRRFLEQVARRVVGCLTPAGRKMGEGLGGSFVLFSPLLRLLALHQTLFPGILVRCLGDVVFGVWQVERGRGTVDGDMSRDVVREAALEWILHLFRSDEWMRRSRRLRERLLRERESVIVRCAMFGGEWGSRLGRRLVGLDGRSEDPAVDAEDEVGDERRDWREWFA